MAGPAGMPPLTQIKKKYTNNKMDGLGSQAAALRVTPPCRPPLHCGAAGGRTSDGTAAAAAADVATRRRLYSRGLTQGERHKEE